MDPIRIATTCFALVGLVGVACKGQPSSRRGTTELQPTSSPPSAAKVAVEGAGSTFIFPLMSRWSTEYQKVTSGVDIDYQPIGSHEGVFQLRDQTVDFAATDAPLTDDQMKDAKAPVVHIPLALGAVVPTYNLPQFPHPVRFTPEALSGIFLGQVKVWNDPKIAAENSDLHLPPTPIVVVHRADGSGTTNVWTDYLSKVSPEWHARVGTGTKVDWPAGVGGTGNEGVEKVVRRTPGAIGYVELNYAVENKMPAGSIKNRAGRYVQPTLESVLASTPGVVANIPEDLRYSLTDAPGDAAWPVSGTTWAVVYRDVPAGPDRSATLGFLRWTLHDGQRYCGALNYVPLPPELVQRADAKLNSLKPAGR